MKRAVIIALPLAVLGAAAASYSDLYAFKKLGSYQLPPGVIAILALVLAANLVVRRFAPSKALTRSEMLLVYAAVAVAVLFAGSGGDSAFMPSLLYPYYFANATNHLASLVHPYVPSWLVPKALAATASGFFEGVAPGAPIPWRVWVGPVLAWSLLLAGMYGISVSVALLVYDRWARHERLRFPLAEIPLALAGGQTRSIAFRIKVGVAMAVALGLVQGIPYSLPSFPALVTRWVVPAPASPPWSAWGDTIINLSPAVIGLSYIISSDVCFTLVAFHMLFRLMNVAALSAGLPIDAEQDYWVWKEYQALICFGGYVAFALGALWPLAATWRAGRRAVGRIERSGYAADRRAGALLVASLVVAGLWMYVLGLSPLTVVAAIAIYLVFVVVLTRVVCEIGLFLIQPPILPTDVLAGLGIARQGADAALISFIVPSVLFEIRGSALPALMHGMRLADLTEAPKRWYLGAMLAVVPFAAVTAYAVHLHVFYRHGALQCLDVWSAKAEAGIGFDNIARRLGTPPGIHWSRVGWMGAGMVLLLAVQQLRRWLLWFPVNPIGMIMSVSYPSVTLWASLAVGGALKVLMLRYGGKRVHDAGKDVAIGLVLGHVAVTLIWYAFDFLTGTSARPLGLE